MTDDEPPPILADKSYDAPSAFTPESLLREATAAEVGPDRAGAGCLRA